MGVRVIRAGVLIAAHVLLIAPAAFAQRSELGELSAEGQNTVRVENEYKLVIPDAIVEEVWQYLTSRYGSPSFLDRASHKFTATVSPERFTDEYFDTPSLDLMKLESSVRHRRRVVDNGGDKDGRQLLQLKLRTADATGVCRSEIKFKVDPPRTQKDDEDRHPVLGLLSRKSRAEFKQRVADIGLRATDLRPILGLEQIRRRVYISDEDGAFATLTLDEVNCSEYGAQVGFTELEIELNEVRYTEANEAERAAMQAVNNDIKSDIAARFPATVQDQVPKYNKTFARLSGAWPPLPFLIRHNITRGEFTLWLAIAACAAATGVATLVTRPLIRHRRRAQGRMLVRV